MEFVVRKQIVQIIIRIKDFQEHLRTSIRDKINFKNCECSFLHAKRGYGMCFIKCDTRIAIFVIHTYRVLYTICKFVSFIFACWMPF